jgi:hypothetical protein
MSAKRFRLLDTAGLERSAETLRKDGYQTGRDAGPAAFPDRGCGS